MWYVFFVFYSVYARKQNKCRFFKGQYKKENILDDVELNDENLGFMKLYNLEYDRLMKYFTYIQELKYKIQNQRNKVEAFKKVYKFKAPFSMASKALLIVMLRANVSPVVRLTICHASTLLI